MCFHPIFVFLTNHLSNNSIKSVQNCRLERVQRGLNIAQCGTQEVFNQISRAIQLNLWIVRHFGLCQYLTEDTIQVTQKCSNSGLKLGKSILNGGIKLSNKLGSIRNAIQEVLNGLEQVIDNSLEVSNDTVDRVEEILEVCLLQISYIYEPYYFFKVHIKQFSLNMQISHREKGNTRLIIMK